MGSANQDRFGSNATLLVDRFSDGLDKRTPHQQGIDPDQGNASLSVIEHGRSDFTRIVDRSVIRLAVTARLLHANLGSDVTFGKTDLECVWWRIGLSRITRNGSQRHSGCDPRRSTDNGKHGGSSRKGKMQVLVCDNGRNCSIPHYSSTCGVGQANRLLSRAYA